MKSIFFFIISLAIIIAACTSSKEGANTGTQNYVSEKIPPGTAIVEAEVKSIEENFNAFELNVQINKVNGYGPSTKPIAPKSMMKVSMPKTLLTGEQDKDFLKADSVYELEILQPYKTMNGGVGSSWNVNTIKKIR